MKIFDSPGRISFMLTCIFLIFISSCEKKENDKNGDLLDGNLLKSASAYKNALNSRDAKGDAVFTVEEIKREGSSLNIRVQGGCSAESYRIIWDGLIAESYPAQVRMVLVHDPADDICQTSEEFLISVDLHKIVGELADSNDFVFYVANGSIKQDKSLNPDGSVSSDD